MIGWTSLGEPSHGDDGLTRYYRAGEPVRVITSETELEELRQRLTVVHRNTPQEWDWRRFGRG